jgi:hypothetical protein
MKDSFKLFTVLCCIFYLFGCSSAKIYNPDNDVEVLISRRVSSLKVLQKQKNAIRDSGLISKALAPFPFDWSRFPDLDLIITNSNDRVYVLCELQKEIDVICRLKVMYYKADHKICQWEMEH